MDANRPRARRAWGTAVIFALWFTTTAWMVRYEWFPEYFAQHSLRGYWGLLREGPLLLDQWMRIDYAGQPVGYSHTEIESQRTQGEEVSTVKNRTSLNLPVLGEARRLTMTVEARLDASYRMSSFKMDIYARPYVVSVKGKRAAGTTFNVTLETGSSRSALKVDIPDDAVLYSPMTEVAMKALKPGQTLRIRTFDPATLTVADVLVRAERTETIRLKKTGDTTATRLLMNFQGMELISWVDDQGRLLRQETPLGWTMEASDADEVLNLKFDGQAFDLLGQSAVPLTGQSVEEPRRTSYWRVRLTGLKSPSDFRISSPLQTVNLLPGGPVEVERRRESPPSDPPIVLTDDERKTALQSSPFVQADHPDILERANRIVRGAGTETEKADAIHDFVHGHIRKTPAINLPSALDVLQKAQGDCNEHTYLAVALARAAGLPARIKVGVSYNEGALYYHAWPAMFADGRWIESDPTFGQRRADAARISLIEGELSEQLALLGVIGHLRAEVLEVRHD